VTDIAFQADAFQHDTFQTATDSVVAGTYTLGSPSFGAPGVVEVLTANPYSLGHPSFATPPVTILQLVVHANSYFLGRPAFGAPLIGQHQNLAKPADYSLQSPAFAAPRVVLTSFFFANTTALGSPTFAAPAVHQNHVVHADAYSLSLSWPVVPSVGLIDVHVVAPTYDLSLVWHYPRMEQTPQVDRWPAFYRNKVEETTGLLGQILKKLMATVPPQSPTAYVVRRLCGDLSVQARWKIANGGFGEALQECFDAAVDAGAKLGPLDSLRTFILGLSPKTDMAVAVVQSSLFFTLAEEAKVVSQMEFSSRDDVAAMIKKMGEAYEEVTVTVMDFYSDILYQSFLALSSALMQHLYLSELTLPMVVSYQTAGVRTALTLAQLIYADASRSDEVVAENKVVHPAFVPRQVRVLSQ